MFKKYYLAYGSNLNINQMRKRCPHSKPIGSIILNNYRLVFKGGEDSSAYLTLERSDGSNVPLGIFEVSYSDIYCLDFYEGYPVFYSKYYIPIKVGRKTKKALIYIMNEQFDYHLPSPNYIETCIEGYNDFGFDTTILDIALKDTIDNKSKGKIYRKY